MMIFLSKFFSSNRGIGLLFVLAARCLCVLAARCLCVYHHAATCGSFDASWYI